MRISSPVCSFPGAGWASDRRPFVGGVWDTITYGEAWLWGFYGDSKSHMFFFPGQAGTVGSGTAWAVVPDNGCGDGFL